MDNIRAAIKAEIASDIPHPKRFRDGLLNEFLNIRYLSSNDWDKFDTDTGQYLCANDSINDPQLLSKKKPRKIHNPWSYHYSIRNYLSCAN